MVKRKHIGGTYKACKDFKWLNACQGTTVRPQLCNDKRFNFRNPKNALPSIFAKLLSDKTL